MCKVGKIGKFFSILLLLSFLLPLFAYKANAADIIVTNTRLGTSVSETWSNLADFTVSDQHRIVYLSSIRYKGISYSREYGSWRFYNYSNKNGVQISYRILADETVVHQGTTTGSYDQWNRETIWSIPSFSFKIKGVKNIKVQFQSNQSLYLQHYSYDANYSDYNEIRTEHTDRLTAEQMDMVFDLEEAKTAAQNAEAAATSAMTEAINAKNIASDARDIAHEILLKVDSIESSITNMAGDLDLSWDNQKTATLNSGEWLNVSSTGDNFEYRYSVNNESYTSWENLSEKVYINLGAQKGYKNISFQIGQGGQPLSTKHIGIWKL